MNEQEFAEINKVGLSDLLTDGIVAIISRLYVILVAAVLAAKTGAEKATTGVKLAVATVSENAETVQRGNATASSVRHTVFSAIAEDHSLAVLLPDLLSEIIGEIRDVRTLVMQGMDVPTEETSEEDSDSADHVLTATYAKKMLENFATLLGSQGKTLDDLPDEMLRKNGKGETVLSLPKLPASTKKEDATAGRDAKVYRMTFQLDGERVPDRIGFDRLAVWYCSTTVDRINGSELKALILRNTGKEWSDQDTFQVKVPNGTLSATLVKK